MKLGVMSDSHDNVPRVEAAVDLFNRRPSLLFNPGEVVGWLTDRATAVVVDLETMGVEIVDLD